jgi:dienelactone hydrolase
MKHAITVILLLVICIGGLCQAAQDQRPAGNWTGGFWLNGNWVAVLVRFKPVTGDQQSTADVVFPMFGSQNSINVPVANIKQTSAGVHFEIPAPSQRVIIFDGQQEADTITGNYVYGQLKGTFGLTRWASPAPSDLPKYYGAYRVAPDRVISVFRGWSYGRTLNYVDYKTGEVGLLWPSSDGTFFAGHGLAISFPVTLHVSFNIDNAGNVTSLIWQKKNEPEIVAQKIKFKEERITFKNGDVTLAGTLILPAREGRYPVVIVTPGDYGTNRDQLRMWAHNFTSQNFGALIFDARGGGESAGQVNSSSFSELANDVVAGVQVLKARADINPKQIGLFGFSNSCFIISLAASRSQDVAFLVMQSFVGVTGAEQETFRTETQLRVDGFPDTDIKKASDFMRLKYEVARTGKGWPELQSIIEKARGEAWLGYTAPPNNLERLQQTYQAIMTYDPIPALEKLHIPILAMWGSKDTFLPVARTVPRFKGAMAKAGNKHYVIEIYRNGSHSLLVTNDGSPSSGGKETNFMPGLWKMEIDWLRKQLSVQNRHVGLASSSGELQRALVHDPN